MGSNAGMYRECLPGWRWLHVVELFRLGSLVGSGKLYPRSDVYTSSEPAHLTDPRMFGQPWRLGTDARMYRKRLSRGRRVHVVELFRLVSCYGSGKLYHCARVYTSGHAADFAISDVSGQPRRLGTDARMYRKRLPCGRWPNVLELFRLGSRYGAGKLHGPTSGSCLGSKLQRQHDRALPQYQHFFDRA